MIPMLRVLSNENGLAMSILFSFQKWIEIYYYQALTLPAVVSKCSVSFCHFVYFFTSLNSTAGVVCSVKNFVRLSLNHCFFSTHTSLFHKSMDILICTEFWTYFIWHLVVL